MARVSIEIDDKDFGVVVAAFVRHYSYQSEVSDPDNPDVVIANPQSEQEFFLEQLRNHLFEVVKADLLVQSQEKAQKAFNKQMNSLDNVVVSAG